MSIVSLGDLARTFTLSHSASTLKTDIQRLTSELTSGLASDTAAHLGGDFGLFAGIQSSLAQIEGYQSVTAEMEVFTQSQQSALGRIGESAGDLGQSLLAGATVSTPSRISALGADAAQKFEAAVSALNTGVGGRSLFAGTATTTAPLPTGATLLDTLQTLVSGANNAADVQLALEEWFDGPAGYTAAYRGGNALAEVGIATGETARVDVTATDPAIRDIMKGLAMAALLDRGVLQDRAEDRADLARRAGQALWSTQTGLSELTARLGTTQALIEQAARRNTAEASALNIARSELLSLDGYEVATRLQQTQTQLETLYTLTARMSRLNLVSFL